MTYNEGIETMSTDKPDDTDTISASDIQARSQALHDTQELWEEVSYLSAPKMPCRECGGSGMSDGGIFSSTCPNCLGERVVDMPPGAERAPMPDFTSMRKQLGAYGDALALNRALPAGDSVPTMAMIQDLKQQALTMAKAQLSAGTAPGTFDPKQLPAPKKPTGMMSDGDLGDIADAELTELEDRAK